MALMALPCWGRYWCHVNGRDASDSRSSRRGRTALSVYVYYELYSSVCVWALEQSQVRALAAGYS